MRFTELNEDDQKKAMLDLFLFIDKSIFSRKLTQNVLPMKFGIESAKRYDGYFCGKEWKITFVKEFINHVSKLDEETEKEQIITIMLHEMIHAYCFVNWISSSAKHGREFMNEAKAHGLDSIYSKNGRYISEQLQPQTREKLMQFEFTRERTVQQ